MRYLSKIFILLSLYPLISKGQLQADLKTINNNESPNEVYEAYQNVIEHYSLFSLDTAIYFSRQYIDFSDAQNDANQQIFSRCLLSSFYEDATMYNIALEVSLSAMELLNASDSEVIPRIEGALYTELGWIYDNLNDHTRSQFFFRRALELGEARADIILRGYANYCIGSYYLFSENPALYDSAISYLEEANRLIQGSTASFDSIVNVETELALGYALLHRIQEAKSALQKLDLKYEQMGPYHQGYTDAARYHIYKHEGRYMEALAGFQDLLDFTIKMGIGTTEESINVTKEIIEIAQLIGDSELALATYEELRQRENEWLEIQKVNRTNELQIQYETAKKEQELIYQADQIKQKNIIIYVVSISAILVLFVLATTIYLLKRIRKKNKQIETLMRELHHRVKNNLQVISSLLGLQSSKLTDESAQKAVEEGKERIRAMSLIHQKLYQQSDVSSVNLKEYLETLVKEICDSYGFGGKADIQIHIPEIPMDVDTTMPLGLIVNELVSNSFKYAFKDIEKPLLKLEVLRKENQLFELSILDNGSGLPPQFDFEQAKSFGLKLVKLLIRQLGANLEIDQSKGLEYKIKFQSAK